RVAEGGVLLALRRMPDPVHLAQVSHPDRRVRHTHAHFQMTSANVRSVRRKCRTPMNSSTATAATVTPIATGISGSVWPRRDHRNPSINPTTGFRTNHTRYGSGTADRLNPTGEMYTPNCKTNGITYLKSRYFTFRAASHTPTD